MRLAEKPPDEFPKSASAFSVHLTTLYSTVQANHKVALAHEAFCSSRQTFCISPVFEGALARAARSSPEYANSLCAASHPLSS